MEALLNKLENLTKEVRDIMLLAQSSFKIVEYLYLDKAPLELEVIKQNQFLKYSREIHWRIYVTELSKLLANRPGDYYNLHKFIEKFKPGFEYNSVKSINLTTLTAWENQLISVKDKIDNLLLQRDKLYSHTDKSRAGVKNILSIKDARELINIVQQVVYDIYNSVFGTHMSFDPIGEPLDGLKNIMAAMVQQKKDLINSFITHSKDVGIDPADVGLPSDLLK
ncbi:hypothetical protein [Mucilaginibacter sp. 3215]|uniref:AbiU2 domain-containing protein n=1 Tax=Mucilaginibacter sp. 3215 TaxID=3373912 RepID=UPI003D1C234B